MHLISQLTLLCRRNLSESQIVAISDTVTCIHVVEAAQPLGLKWPFSSVLGHSDNSGLLNHVRLYYTFFLPLVWPHAQSHSHFLSLLEHITALSSPLFHHSLLSLDNPWNALGQTWVNPPDPNCDVTNFKMIYDLSFSIPLSSNHSCTHPFWLFHHNTTGTFANLLPTFNQRACMIPGCIRSLRRCIRHPTRTSELTSLPSDFRFHFPPLYHSPTILT